MFSGDLDLKLSPPGTSTSVSTSRDTATKNTSNPNNSHEVTPPPTDTVSSLSFSPRADYLVATTWDHQVGCWEVSRNGASISSQLKASISHDAPVLCSAWSDDGTTVFTGGCDKQAKMWSLSSVDQTITVAMHDDPISKLAWIQGRNLLVTGSWDSTLKYWDMRQKKLVHTQQLPGKCYALTVKDSLIVVGAGDRKIVVFDLQNPQTEYMRIESPVPYQTRCLAAFPDQKGFLVGSNGGRIGVHHLIDAQKSQDYTFPCHKLGDTFYSINSLNFHPIHGTYSSIGSDGTFSFWDKDTKLRIKASKKCDQPISCSTFNHDGSIFAYAVGYDWSKGAEYHNRDGTKAIFLHQPEENDVKPRLIPNPKPQTSGRFTITHS